MTTPSPQLAALGQEWQTLQNNYEQYEKSALLIKLTAIVMAFVAFGVGVNYVLMGALVALLWVQEAVFRTYQSRLGERLLRIEQLVVQDGASDSPFQLHSQWLAARKGLVGLIAEYAKSALKPTVAFPYLILILIELTKLMV